MGFVGALDALFLVFCLIHIPTTILVDAQSGREVGRVAHNAMSRARDGRVSALLVPKHSIATTDQLAGPANSKLRLMIGASLRPWQSNAHVVGYPGSPALVPAMPQ